MATDYPILGAPTISEGAFYNVLRSAGSPAAGEAAGIYAAFTARGVNPAIGLAIFQHESTFGKYGYAAQTKSLGNIVGTGNAGKVGRFAKYSSWTAGAQAAAALLASSSYGRSTHYNTAGTFAFRWAPAADHNAPAAYGKAVIAAVSRWSGGKGAITAPPSPAAPAKAKAKPTASGAPSILSATKAHVAAHPTASGAAAGIGGAVVLLLLL